MKKNVSFVICLVIGIILFWGKPEDRINKSQFLNNTIFYPFLYLYHFITNNHENELTTLKQELIQTQLRYNKIQEKFSKYQFSVSAQETVDLPFVLADVIGQSGTLEKTTLLINKGGIDLIEKNAPVISTDGIVGKVIQINPHQAFILPYHHQHFQAAVMTKKNQIQGILQSDLQGLTKMNFLRLTDEINIGDTIVTSHLSTIFPSGIPVGKVKKIINSEDQVHKSAILERFCKPERLAQVAVIIKGNNYEK